MLDPKDIVDYVEATDRLIGMHEATISTLFKKAEEMASKAEALEKELAEVKKKKSEEPKQVEKTASATNVWGGPAAPAVKTSNRPSAHTKAEIAFFTKMGIPYKA